MAPGFDAIDERYGARSPGRRRVVVALAVAVVAAGVGWLGWVVWETLNPQVSSGLVTWHARDEHRVDATIEVDLRQGVRAHCVVQATAVDHSVVGEVTFVPHDGTNEVRLRTERKATSVTLEGCTAPGQPRPR